MEKDGKAVCEYAPGYLYEQVTELESLLRTLNAEKKQLFENVIKTGASIVGGWIGGMAGGATGMWAAARTGAMVVSFLGPVGTLLGTAVGAVTGALGGGFLGSTLGSQAAEAVADASLDAVYGPQVKQFRRHWRHANELRQDLI